MKTWFITGVSRGLGLALAKAALERGDAVVGTVRGGVPELQGPPERLRIIVLDLASAGSIDGRGLPPAGSAAEWPSGSIDEAVAAAFAHTGRVDVLVNNAGYGLLGALEQASDAELERLFAVDVFGPVRILRAALPRLRAQGSGHIINITSIAGRAPGTSASLYSAAKAALEGLSAGLAQELAPFGIHVTAVAPGAFRTDFLAPHSLRKSAEADAGYAASVGKSLAAFDAMNGKQLGDPARGAHAILAIADAAAPPLHVLLGSDALRRMRDKLRAVTDEIDRWQELTCSTDGTW